MAQTKDEVNLHKDVDAINTPSNRVLVRSLILAIITIFSLLQWGTQGRIKDLNNEKNKDHSECKEEKIRMQRVIDSLSTIIYINQEAKSQILRGMIEWQDSVKRVLKTSGL